MTSIPPGGLPTIVLEVQLAIDPDKPFAWPAYLASVRLRDRCEAVLVVVTVDRAVADWARKPIVLGPGTQLQPLVIGPDEVPKTTDLAEARRDPELATLSALAHARDKDETLVLQIAAAASTAALELPGGRGLKHYDLVLACMSEATRKALEMLTGNYQLQDAGLRKAWAEGEAEGEIKGKAEGKAEGGLAVLEARGLPVTAAERARILASTDTAELDRWLRAAVTAAGVNDVFAVR